MTTNKYGVNPSRLRGQKDMVEYFKDLDNRVGSGETSLRIGNTAIEDGDLVVRNGDIIVSESDETVVMRIMHGAVPEIRMWPLGDIDTHRTAILSYEETLAGQAIAIVVETHPGTDPDGGKLLLAREYAILSHQPDGGEEAFLWLNADFTGTQEIAVMRCRWTDQIQYDSHMGLYMGAFTATSGFTTWTHTYFTPFATTTIPVFTVGVTGTAIQWGHEAYGPSSFTIRFSTTTGNKLVTFWNFRV